MEPGLIELLARCHPLEVLGQAALRELAEHGVLKTHGRGQVLLRRGDAAGEFVYLLAGEAELRRSFFDRVTLRAGAEPALQSLGRLIPAEGGQILAHIDECITFSVSAERVEAMLSALASEAYGVDNLGDQRGDEFLISDGAVDIDWMARFLQSTLAHSLPPICIQQLLACLRANDVARGSELVRQGEIGEEMFIVTRGMAVVKTDQGGVFGGREFSLMPGDYFGEEALVADTVRNATVVMDSDGAVARLNRAMFNELIRPHLIRVVTAPLPPEADLIDVRFPVEFRRDAVAGSRNVPISQLRAQLTDFPTSRPILVSDAGGQRAELAVFLLRQVGLDAWLLPLGSSADGTAAA